MDKSPKLRDNRLARVDNSHAIFETKQAITGHVIFSADHWHFVFSAERGDVHEKPFGQYLFELAVAVQYNSPLPFSTRRRVGHGVVAKADKFAAAIGVAAIGAASFIPPVLVPWATTSARRDASAGRICRDQRILENRTRPLQLAASFASRSSNSDACFGFSRK